jgi:hypothetical protein
VAGDGVDAGPGVPLQGPDRSVAGTGEQDGGNGAILGFVGERGMAELVQGPPATGLELGRVGDAGMGQRPGVGLEQLRRAAV